jgi:hypothetical protein
LGGEEVVEVMYHHLSYLLWGSFSDCHSYLSWNWFCCFCFFEDWLMEELGTFVGL